MSTSASVPSSSGAGGATAPSSSNLFSQRIQELRALRSQLSQSTYTRPPTTSAVATEDGGQQSPTKALLTTAAATLSKQPSPPHLQPPTRQQHQATPSSSSTAPVQRNEKDRERVPTGERKPPPRTDKQSSTEVPPQPLANARSKPSGIPQPSSMDAPNTIDRGADETIASRPARHAPQQDVSRPRPKETSKGKPTVETPQPVLEPESLPLPRQQDPPASRTKTPVKSRAAPQETAQIEPTLPSAVASKNERSVSPPPAVKTKPSSTPKPKEEISPERGQEKDREKASKSKLKEGSTTPVKTKPATAVPATSSKEQPQNNRSRTPTSTSKRLPTTPGGGDATVGNQMLYKRYQATVKLLAESLEEQGNLRALMELTLNPKVFDPLLQDEIFHLTNQFNSDEYDEDYEERKGSGSSRKGKKVKSPKKRRGRDDSEDYDDSYDEEEPYVSVSKEFLMNVKNRALMLEQDQLIAQTIDLRSQLEEEKQKRMKAEAELKATSTLLEDARKDIETLNDQLDKLEQEMLQGSFHGPNRRQKGEGMSLPPTSPSGTPTVAQMKQRKLMQQQQQKFFPNANASSSTGGNYGKSKLSAVENTMTAKDVFSPAPPPLPPTEPPSTDSLLELLDLDVDIDRQLEEELGALSATNVGNNNKDNKIKDTKKAALTSGNNKPVTKNSLEELEDTLMATASNVANPITTNKDRKVSDKIDSDLEIDIDADLEVDAVPSVQDNDSVIHVEEEPPQEKVLVPRTWKLAEDPQPVSANKSRGTEEAKKTAPRSEEKKIPSSSDCVVLDINIDDNNSDQIVITCDDHPMMLALDFMQKHSLPESYFEPLVDYVSHTQAQLIRESIAAAEASGSRSSSPTNSPGKGNTSNKKVSPTKDSVPGDNVQPNTAAPTVTTLRTASVAVDIAPLTVPKSPVSPLPVFEDSDLEVDGNLDGSGSDFYPPPPPSDDGDLEGDDDDFNNLSALPTEDEFYQPFGDETPMKMSFDESGIIMSRSKFEGLGSATKSFSADESFFDGNDDFDGPQPPPSPPSFDEEEERLSDIQEEQEYEDQEEVSQGVVAEEEVDVNLVSAGDASEQDQVETESYTDGGALTNADLQDHTNVGSEYTETDELVNDPHQHEDKEEDSNEKPMKKHDEFEMIVTSNGLDESEIESVDLEVDLSALEDNAEPYQPDEDDERDEFASYADDDDQPIVSKSTKPSGSQDSTSSGNHRVGSGRFKKLFEQFAEKDSDAPVVSVVTQAPVVNKVPEKRPLVPEPVSASKPKVQPQVQPQTSQHSPAQDTDSFEEVDPIDHLNYSASRSPVRMLQTPSKQNTDIAQQALSPSFQLRSLSSSPYPVDKSIGNEEIGEIIDVAQNVLLRAHELRDDGQLHYAIPLYYDALRLLELSEFTEMEQVRVDVDNHIQLPPSTAEHHQYEDDGLYDDHPRYDSEGVVQEGGEGEVDPIERLEGDFAATAHPYYANGESQEGEVPDQGYDSYYEGSQPVEGYSEQEYQHYVMNTVNALYQHPQAQEVYDNGYYPQQGEYPPNYHQEHYPYEGDGGNEYYDNGAYDDYGDDGGVTSRGYEGNEEGDNDSFVIDINDFEEAVDGGEDDFDQTNGDRRRDSRTVGGDSDFGDYLDYADDGDVERGVYPSRRREDDSFDMRIDL